MTELIVALDVPNVKDAEAIISRLGNAVDYYKIGLELALNGGLDLAKELLQQNTRVFLDLKMFDIGNTVGKAIENAVNLGVNLTTIHAMPQTMEWAAKAAAGSHTQVVAVTVLTSWDAETLKQSGVNTSVEETVISRAKAAHAAGLSGVVASVHEAAKIRAATHPKFLIVTPGIRLSDGEINDQKRIATPEFAVTQGSTHLVVGRPITQSNAPLEVIAEIKRQLNLLS